MSSALLDAPAVSEYAPRIRSLRPAGPDAATLAAMDAFVAGRRKPTDVDGERRRHPRWAGAIRLRAWPVVGPDAPVGDPVDGVLFDLSYGGMSVLTAAPLDAAYLSVEMPVGRPGGPGKRLTLRVLRRQVAGPYHVAAGELLR